MKNSGRRQALRALSALGLWSALPAAWPQIAARPRFADYPFSLGVASGYPTPGGMVLWTRLAPTPQAPAGGMGLESVAVRWEVATDEGFAKVVASGSEYASADWAHSVHVEITGLSPARPYWYRFHAGDTTSPIGHTRTAPGPAARGGRLRLALASCQQYEQGFYGAYRHLAADNPDLVVFAGDYIYEASWGRDHVRKHGAADAVTLDDYRRRYVLYKSDPDLQAAHAVAPWAVIWDDHEVANDYAADHSETADDPAWFLARRAGAYKAWYEHMPVPRRMLPLGPHARIHTRLAWGSLASINLLDCRQYRTPQACPRPGRGGSNSVDAAACAELTAPGRSMLGETQSAWLRAGLQASRTRWNLIAQQTRMAQWDTQAGTGRRVWTDGWDGYPAERRQLLEHLSASKTANPVFIAGDVHMFYVNDLRPDFDRPESAPVATEFIGTSISSQAGSQDAVNRALPENPHVRFADSRYRGYTRFDITPESMAVELRAMETVQNREAACSTLASFAVENGRPGAQRA